MKGERIVRRTLADRKQGRTDWQRLRDMTEAEVDRGAQSDPDNPPWTEAELRNARLVLPAGEAKIPLSIRLDREVIDYFKAQGPGYQSRIGAVLLSYVRSQESGRAQRAARDSEKQRASTKRSQSTAAKRSAKASRKTDTKR